MRPAETIQLTLIKRVAVFALLAIMIIGVSGCKQSDVLFHTTYNQKAEQKSNDDQMVDNDEDHEEINQDLSSKEERDEAEKNRGYQNTEAVENDNDNETQAAQTVDSPSAIDRRNGYANSGSSSSSHNSGTVGESSSGGNGSGNQNGSESNGAQLGGGGGGTTGSGSGGDNGGEGSGSGGESGEGNDIGEKENEAEQAGETGEKLHATDTVFAAGEAALLAQMIGGSGALMGADATEINAMAQFFPAEELSGIAAIFDDSGMMNTAAIEAMSTLPTYCLLDTSNYTEAVQSAMEAYGITCIVLDFHNAGGILNAVEIVKETLGTDVANTNASRYTTLYNEILSASEQKIGTYSENGINFDNTMNSLRKKDLSSTCNDGKYTLLVTGWDYGESLTFTKANGWSKTFSGLAIANRGYTDSPASYFMQRAGTLNKGATTVLYTDYTPVYVNPLRTVVHGAALSGSGTLTLENQDTVNHYELLNVSTLTEGLGSSSYPAIVVSSAEVRDAILNNKTSNGMWTVYGFDENNQNRGFEDADGTYIWSVISGDYDIYVNPNGLGDWIGGSSESVLETVWIGNMFHDKAFSDEELNDYLKRFYSTFYRCELTDAQIRNILAGR